MTRRILVVNSNSSPSAGAAIGALAGEYATDTTELVTKSASAGCTGIDGRLDSAIAAVETAKVIAAHRHDFDSFVIACGNDPGLAAAREIAVGPVVGTAEAGILQACVLGARFAIPVFSAAKVTAMHELVAGYGLSRRLAAVVAMETTVRQAVRSPDALYHQLSAAARRARDDHRADVVVLTGTVMAPVAARLQADLGIPVVAGLRAAVTQAESLVDADLSTSRFHGRGDRRPGGLVGYPDFADLYDHTNSEQELSR
ncbi:aspartate/glutamate racemase family protein [Gordonia sp. NPDC003376]